jgi:hypothetical protein
MSYSIRCPVCRQKFPWDPLQGFPEFCPNEGCESRIAHDRADDDIVLPFVRNHGFTKSVDDVYRKMEEGSITRAQIAAQITGSTEAEMSSLKITDLNDHQRPGDLAAKLPSNPVSDLMAAAPQVSGFQPAMGLQFSQQTGVGPQPNRGAQMRSALHSQHSEWFGGSASSDRPSNETMQPGYRRRG